MILSILIGAGIYILLQVAFIGAIDPKLLISQHTWTNLGGANTNPAVVALNEEPFYTVTKVAGLAWLAFILRLDAVISPSGTGLVYLTSTSRISFALSRMATSHPHSRPPTSGRGCRCSGFCSPR